MINVPEILHRHVNLIGVVNLGSVLERQKLYLQEAEKVEGAGEVVTYIQEAVDATQAHVERFTKSLIPFEKAALAHDEANRICIRACALHGAGSDDAKTALKLRDDLEIAQRRERIARRKFDEARAGLPSLPESQVVFTETTKAADVVETWASISANRIFKRRDGKIDQEVWNKWLDMSSDFVRWIPLFLSREIARCEALWTKHRTADKLWDRGDTHAAEPDDLRNFYKQLIEDRETRRAMKVLEAKRRLAQAEQEATQ